MPTPTYTALANITLGSSASSVTFSSIPATYRDLVLVGSGAANANAQFRVFYNGDTTTGNYTRVYMFGNGSTTFSNTDLPEFGLAFDSSISAQVLQIMDYSATDKHKTSLARDSRATFGVGAIARRWANTAAITSIAISSATNTLNAGTTFALYGIAS